MSAREAAQNPHIIARETGDETVQKFYDKQRDYYNNSTKLALHEETLLNFRTLDVGAWVVLTACMPNEDSKGYHGVSYIDLLVKNELGRFSCAYLGSQGGGSIEFELEPTHASVTEHTGIGVADSGYPVVQKGGFLHGTLSELEQGFEIPDWRFGPVVSALHMSDIAAPDDVSMLYLN